MDLFPIGGDAAEAGSDRFTIKATSHAAKVGDLIKVISGANVGECRTIVKIDTDEFQVSKPFPTKMDTGHAFLVYRYAEVKRTFGGGATGADREVIAAVTGKILRGCGVQANITNSGTLVFKSATTAITSTPTLPANGGITLPYCTAGWFQTAAGEALNGNVGAGAFVAHLIYAEL